MIALATSSKLTEALAATIQPKTDLQREAFKEFINLGLPGPKNEEYKHTPITRELEKHFNPSLPLAGKSSLPDVLHWKIHPNGAYALVFLNGRFAPEHTALPEGLRIMPLAQALHSEHAEAIKHFAKYAPFRADAFTAWNTAAWTDGLYIEIPDGLEVKQPLYLYYLHHNPDHQALTVTRNLVVVGRGSRATLVEKWFTTGSHVAVSNALSELVLQQGAWLNHVVIQTDPGNHIQHLTNQFYQEKDSLLNSYVITLDGRFIRNNTRVTLDGACESHLYGLYLLHDRAFADNHTVVDHRQAHAMSNELYKGVLADGATGVFNGKIYVRPGAQKTNAFQSNRNLLLSEQATVHTKPQLEIWADDVKCSHGCTVGQIDEDALFYLRTRGIDGNTAKAMLLYAFASEVTETLPDEELKTYLSDLIGKRLYNTAQP